jgi:2,4-dienoyl-CoA reductase-like NADH-dependent reductase (Old Yellow Enzyme family)|nr:hypothetical protein [uncultured Methanomethylovorans sp.]
MVQPDSIPTSSIGGLYEGLHNEIGLIITEYAHVNSKGKSDNLQQGIYDDRFIEPYKEIISRFCRNLRYSSNK